MFMASGELAPSRRHGQLNVPAPMAETVSGSVNLFVTIMPLYDWKVMIAIIGLSFHGRERHTVSHSRPWPAHSGWQIIFRSRGRSASNDSLRPRHQRTAFRW